MHCKNCGSTEIKNRSGIYSLIRRCDGCGLEWTSDQDELIGLDPSPVVEEPETEATVTEAPKKKKPGRKKKVAK